MTAEPILALVAEVRSEAAALEAAGENPAPLRRFADRLEARVLVAVHETAYLSTADYAARIGVTGELVRQWCQAGRLPGAIRVGRSWKIPQQAKRPSRAA